MQRIWIYFGLVMGLMAGCRPVAVHRSQETIRIVSLAPSLTESLCAIGAGDLLVGRTSACNYPPAVVTNVPIVGDFGHPSLELLLKVNPTLVLDTALADESIGAQISALGLRRERVSCDSLSDIAPMLRHLGTLTGHQAAANALATRIAETIADARAAQRQSQTTNQPRPTVYSEVWHDPLITIGHGTFLADLIQLAGGRPIADSVPKDYFQISPEKVIAENPDIILCLYMSDGVGAAEAVKRRAGWEQVSAVRNGCVFDNLNNDVLLRAGPRLLDGLESLRRYIHQAQRKEAP